MNSSTAAVIAVAVAACNGRDPRPAQAGTPPPVMTAALRLDAPPAGADGADVAAPAGAAAAGEDDVTPAPEVEAFHGRLPALPLVSPSGTLVALDVSDGLGLSSFHTYEVAFVEPGGRERERIAVVDRALAEALLADATRASGPPLQLPRQRLARAAARITERLAGFTPFARELDSDAIGRSGGELALGGVTLGFHGDEGGLALRLVGAGGAVLRGAWIPARPPEFADRDGGRCGGRPRLAGAWWDPPRRRAALLVIFPGRDACEDEPALWLVW
ncbi:MAG TPA: hypothetical protein VHW23_46530 [Kofleriaceae bacterium]|jgi:hypothetical protein|nr:hypothetical protein [Kofleriaceae bacterium]